MKRVRNQQKPWASILYCICQGLGAGVRAGANERGAVAFKGSGSQNEEPEFSHSRARAGAGAKTALSVALALKKSSVAPIFIFPLWNIELADATFLLLQSNFTLIKELSINFLII